MSEEILNPAVEPELETPEIETPEFKAVTQLKKTMMMFKPGSPDYVSYREQYHKARKAYMRVAKEKSRKREQLMKKADAKRAREEENASPSDKRFMEWFDNFSPERRRDWLRVHRLYLRLQCEGWTKDCIARGMDQEKLVRDLATKCQCSAEEVVRESVKVELAKHYGFSLDEMESLLDPAYKKPEPPKSPEPPTVIINGKPERVYDVETKERDSDGNLITKIVKMYWASVNPQVCNVSHVMLSLDDTKEQYEERIRRARQRPVVVL